MSELLVTLCRFGGYSEDTRTLYSTNHWFMRLHVISFLTGLAACVACAHEPPRVISLADEAIVPDAEVDAAGVIHVAYISKNDVYYVSSPNDGESFSKPIRVNTEPGFAAGGGFRGPDLAVGKDNRVHAIWYNAGYQQKRPKEQWGVMYSRLDKRSNRFEESRNLNRKPSDNFSLAADSTGRVAIIWMAGGIFANLSTDGGKTFSPPEDLRLDPCECCGSRTVYSGNGGLSVLYRDKSDNIRDTNVAHLPAGSTVWTNHKISRTPWSIDSCPMTGSFLTVTKAGLLGSWETKNQIYFATISKIQDKAESREIRAARRGRYPVVLSSEDGAKLVAWKNDKDLEWQSFDTRNEPIGTSGRYASGNPHRPAGVATKSGKFLLFP